MDDCCWLVISLYGYDLNAIMIQIYHSWTSRVGSIDLRFVFLHLAK